MNKVILSSFVLAEKYSDLKELVDGNYPLNENTIPKFINRCEEYAKSNNLTFLYPMGITPVYFIFQEKGKSGRKAKS